MVCRACGKESAEDLNLCPHSGKAFLTAPRAIDFPLVLTAIVVPAIIPRALQAQATNGQDQSIPSTGQGKRWRCSVARVCGSSICCERRLKIPICYTFSDNTADKVPAKRNAQLREGARQWIDS